MKQIMFAAVVSFIAIFGLASSPVVLLIAPFGASCVLLFAAPQSPFSQVRNVIGGHSLSAFIGLVMWHNFGVQPLTLALAVALSIAFMMMTKTLHPPAGATTLVVMMTNASFSFLWNPLLLGAVLLVMVQWGWRKLLPHT